MHYVTYSPLIHGLQKDKILNKDGGISMICDDVGNRIRYLRREKGLSQEKLALRADIDRTYLAGIESGKRNPTIVSIQRIVVALDTTMKSFWDFEPYC